MNEGEPKTPAETYLDGKWPINLAIAFGEIAVKYGVTDPFAFPREPNDIKRTFTVYGSWLKYTDKKAEDAGTPIAKEEANFKKTIFLVDAGCTDSTYVAEVIDWLQQDEDRVRNAGLEELADKIKKKINQLTELI
jgi:hypothetical protein